MEWSEIIENARAEAATLALPRSLDTEQERLRTECLRWVERLPEPPLYRRSDERGPVDQTLFAEGQRLVIRVLWLRRIASSVPWLSSLEAIVLLHLEAQWWVNQGQLTRADECWQQAQDLHRAARQQHSVLPAGTFDRPVYDRSTGVSRFDPASETPVGISLVCPRKACRREADYAPGGGPGPQPVSCPHCRGTFLVFLGEILDLQVMHPRGRVRRYAFRLRALDRQVSRVEFDDNSGAELSMVNGDWLALIYSPSHALQGVVNLTTRRVLWISAGGGCFVATMAFGGEESMELTAFRRFRDQVLLQGRVGTMLVHGYYRWGPALARVLSRHAASRGATRWVLKRVHQKLRERGFDGSP